MFLATRFVAGTTAGESIAAVARLNELGAAATFDFLGEDVSSAEEAQQNHDAYVELIGKMKASGVRANLSLKLTAFGLAVDPALTQQLVESILEKATALDDPFVRIDMERSSDVDATLGIFERAFERYKNTGPVLQAYLRRTPSDVERMIELGARVRLCKGAYDEEAAVAHTERAQIRRAFLRLAETLLERGNYPGIATHDPGLIAAISVLANERGYANDRFEFQMLYGVRPSLQREIVASGRRLRVYVPYGTHWTGYFRRRIMERKANALFALTSIFSR